MKGKQYLTTSIMVAVLGFLVACQTIKGTAVGVERDAKATEASVKKSLAEVKKEVKKHPKKHVSSHSLPDHQS